MTYTINKDKFRFRYLPAYASFLLENKLEEFVTVAIRFAREEQLPMLKPLAKLPEQELVKISIESYRQVLSALRDGHISDVIEQNLSNWMNNKLKLLDKDEIEAEDITLAYYIRRKAFAHFLYSYTPNAVLHEQIIAEVDTYTTQEELVSLKVYLAMFKQKIA